MHTYSEAEIAARDGITVEDFRQQNREQRRIPAGYGTAVLYHPVGEPDDVLVVDPNRRVKVTFCRECGHAIGAKIIRRKTTCGCRKEDGDELLGIGKDTYALCHTHKRYRLWGSGIFSGWTSQVEEVGRERAEALWAEQLRELQAEYSPAPVE